MRLRAGPTVSVTEPFPASVSPGEPAGEAGVGGLLKPDLGPSERGAGAESLSSRQSSPGAAPQAHPRPSSPRQVRGLGGPGHPRTDGGVLELVWGPGGGRRGKAGREGVNGSLFIIFRCFGSDSIVWVPGPSGSGKGATGGGRGEARETLDPLKGRESPPSQPPFMVWGLAEACVCAGSGRDPKGAATRATRGMDPGYRTDTQTRVPTPHDGHLGDQGARQTEGQTHSDKGTQIAGLDTAGRGCRRHVPQGDTHRVASAPAAPSCR